MALLPVADFILKTTGGLVEQVEFRFRPGSIDPPAGLACADIFAGDGSYVSEDANGDPFPEPRVNFLLRVSAPACAPDDGLPTRYRLFVLPAQEGSGGDPDSWLPIASQIRLGDGSSTFLTFDMPVSDAPPEVCLYAQVMRGNAMVERAPQRGCLPYTLDAGPPGFSGWD